MFRHFNIYMPNCTGMHDFAYKFLKIFLGLYPEPHDGRGNSSLHPSPDGCAMREGAKRSPIIGLKIPNFVIWRVWKNKFNH
jgi:hypothetical protein